jgi:hypothetical protein
MTPPAAARRPRDPRLDFFRGLAMFIIVMAHTPNNGWTLWIPARFGFSDATEIFVFCSGMASAIAFGAAFARAGWRLGAASVLYRAWQVYWAHIGAFLAVAALTVALNASAISGVDYVGRLNLWRFFDDAGPGLLHLLTLTYVPNYFDILPMYLVILAMLPLFVALAEIHRGLAALAVVTLWLAANLGQATLPAAPWDPARQWFFNPFGWQLLFFLGFSLMAGWLPPPPVRRDLIVLAAMVVILIVPVAHFRLRPALPGMDELWRLLQPFAAKTPFGPLRLLHFLALGYLAWVAVGPSGERLSRGRWWPRLVGVIRQVGQQSLAVFVSGLVLAQLLGAAYDVVGAGPLATAALNLLGIGLVIAVARFVAWIKASPWQAPVPGRALPPATPGPDRPEGARAARPESSGAL